MTDEMRRILSNIRARAQTTLREIAHNTMRSSVAQRNLRKIVEICDKALDKDGRVC